MACSRGRWLRDHTPERFGACGTRGAADSSGTWGAVVVVFVVGTVADSNWRAVEAKARLETAHWRSRLWEARNREAYMVAGVVGLGRGAPGEVSSLST